MPKPYEFFRISKDFDMIAPTKKMYKSISAYATTEWSWVHISPNIPIMRWLFWPKLRCVPLEDDKGVSKYLSSSVPSLNHNLCLCLQLLLGVLRI